MLDRMLSRYKPAVLHNMAIKPAALGSLAALGRPVRTLNSINGLGYLSIARGPVAALARSAIGLSLNTAERFQSGHTLFQNEDDLAYGRARFKLSKPRLHIIAGSGIDTEALTPVSEPSEGPIKFALISRMIAQKGIETAVEAVRHLRAAGHSIELLLCGAPDPGNPTALALSELEEWGAEPGISYLGHVSDVTALLGSVHAVVQPSWGGEGVPRSLLEAAAIARPLIASDVPGNSAVVRTGQTGVLVPARDPIALSAAMAEIAVMSATQRQALGQAARTLVTAEFSEQAVQSAHEAIYRALLSA